MAGESGSTSLWGHTVSDLQEDIAISGNKITGKLKYVDSGALARDWGPGYFMVLKFTKNDDTVTDIKVGMDPSQGSGLVSLDADMNGVFKVTDKDVQDFLVVQTDGAASGVQAYDLSGLTLVEE